MRHISLLAVSLLALAACTPEKQQEADDYTQYVNPFIGTDFTGNTYPGAQVPFGMVQLSPDNGLPPVGTVFPVIFIPTRLSPVSAIPICQGQVRAICTISLSCR